MSDLLSQGIEIGTIREVEQSTTRKGVRLFSGVDQFLTHKLGVFDSEGQQVLLLERPAKLMRSKINVSDAEGTERGAILQDNVVGKKHFVLVGGRPGRDAEAGRHRGLGFGGVG